MEMEKDKKLKRLGTGFSLLLILFALSSLAYIERASIYKGLDRLKLIPQPEHFTELYFENHSSLPKQSISGKNVSFSFTIHNLEGATTTYPYSVYFEYPSGFRVIFQNSTTTIADDMYQTIATSHVWRASNLSGKIIVELTNMDQKIDFILSNK